MKETEVRGYWWLPSGEDNQVAGTLKFGDETRSTLDLLGSFQSTRDAMNKMSTWGEDYSYELILGLGQNGKAYTLMGPRCIGGNFNTNAFIVETFSPRVVIEGQHFKSSEEIILRQVTVVLSHLPEWYEQSDRDWTIEDLPDGRQRTTITHEKRAATEFTWPGGEIRIGQNFNCNFARYAEDMVMKERTSVTISPNEPEHITDFCETLISAVCRFFELGVGRPITILDIKAKTAEDCAGKTGEDLVAIRSINLHWPRDFRGDEDKELFPHDMVFTRTDLTEPLEEHFRKWMAADAEFRPVLDLFFGRVLRRENFSVNSFLNAVQAAEAYHRYRRPGEMLPVQEHENRMTSILEAVPAEHQEWLEGVLGHSNEKRLGKRIKELLREHRELFGLNSHKIKSISNRIKELRNLYTHYSKESEAEFGDASDFYIYDMLCKWLLVACLLEEIGFSRELSHELILRNQSFSFFKAVILHQKKAETIGVSASTQTGARAGNDTEAKQIQEIEELSDE